MIPYLFFLVNVTLLILTLVYVHQDYDIDGYTILFGSNMFVSLFSVIWHYRLQHENSLCRKRGEVHRIKNKGGYKDFFNLNTSTLLHLFWFVNLVQTMIRLFSKEYDTEPIELRFNTLERSLNNWEALGGYLGGVPALFLFDYSDYVFNGYGKTLGCSAIIYFIYNLISHLAKDFHEISSSTYPTKSMDWIIGYYVGINIGLLGKAYIEYYYNDSIIRSSLSKITTNVSGIIFGVATLFATVMYHKSWEDNDVEETMVIALPTTIASIGVIIIVLSTIRGILSCKKRISNNHSSTDNVQIMFDNIMFDDIYFEPA